MQSKSCCFLCSPKICTPSQDPALCPSLPASRPRQEGPAGGITQPPSVGLSQWEASAGQREEGEWSDFFPSCRTLGPPVWQWLCPVTTAPARQHHFQGPGHTTSPLVPSALGVESWLPLIMNVNTSPRPARAFNSVLTFSSRPLHVNRWGKSCFVSGPF